MSVFIKREIGKMFGTDKLNPKSYVDTTSQVKFVRSKKFRLFVFQTFLHFSQNIFVVLSNIPFIFAIAMP